ncbi:hypothetical protein Glove_197g71 [Diversispora epigaea]|uniref:C2H2-type domain-containing protein n=1 Tax=Diversispora epigaea TaxID=1348612 RepID=A0A397IKB8_9GLOM|nr:hypothetical protein Glove_197g71 [Diversispora epigaea]
MSKVQQKININHLDLDRSYTLEEFEYINDQLKYHTLEINGQPVDLFELDEKGKLIPMPQATHCMEVTVGEIVRQLGNWNLHSRQNGDIKTAQGGFDFYIGDQRTIRAPDVSFTPKTVSRQLTQLQRWTFRGEPFTPLFIIEVADTKSKSKFENLDHRFKYTFFAVGTNVQLGLLIDPKNDRIWIYKRNRNGMVFRRAYAWGNIDCGDILPGFILDVEMIEDAISQTSSETSESEGDLEINCPKCNGSFTEDYLFMKHYEKHHSHKPETVDRMMPT